MSKRFFYFVLFLFVLFSVGAVFSEEKIIWKYNDIPDSNDKVSFALIIRTSSGTVNEITQIIEDRCFTYDDVEKKFSTYEENVGKTGIARLRYKLTGPARKIKLIQKDVEHLLDARWKERKYNDE